MRKANIPMDLPEYTIEEWGPVVQAYYDQVYGVGKFKIFVFNNSNVKPIFKSQVQTFTHPILLYHHDHHFDGIRTLSSFMGCKFYCLHCESVYSNHDVARLISCVARLDVSTAEIMVMENVKTFTPTEDFVQDVTRLFTTTTATNDMHQTIPALNLKNVWIVVSSGMSMK